jgi:hypothetical protein
MKNKIKKTDEILIELSSYSRYSGELLDQLDLEFKMYGEVKAETAKKYFDYLFTQTLGRLRKKLNQNVYELEKQVEEETRKERIEMRDKEER